MENDQKTFYDESGVKITSQIIRTQNGTIVRIPDVRDVQTKYELYPPAVPYLWLIWALGIAGALLQIYYGFISLLAIIPAVFCFIQYGRLGHKEYKVYVKTPSGLQEVAGMNMYLARLGFKGTSKEQWLAEFRNEFNKQEAEMDKIHKAIRMAVECG